MFDTILIANRGEIACRVIKTAQRMGINTVAVYSDVDAASLYVSMADRAVHIGGNAASESYLCIDKIIAAAKDTGAQAIHPGYGFLSENPEFVEAVEQAGLIFVGPTAQSIRQMGLKDAAKTLMANAGVPIVPGYHEADQNLDVLKKAADKIGYPVLIKARAGGGGKGMRLVDGAENFEDALIAAQREGQASFNDPHVLIEKYIINPRHIEVQVFGDKFGNVVHLFERDCSLQRRHQKVIEEAPAPGMTPQMREAITNAAILAAQSINYVGAGTIEFIVDGANGLRPDGFWFMEMNTRLQVEHPVTEAITGQDLVEWQLRVAFGEPLPLRQEDIKISGHAFEARIYAEDPANGFLPAPGHLEHLSFDPDARIDTGVRSGDVISPYYDPMIAKVTTHEASREKALNALCKSLSLTHSVGPAHNIDFLLALAQQKDFAVGDVDTGLIERNLDELISKDPTPNFAVLAAFIFANDIDPMAAQLGWQNWGNSVRKTGLVYNDDTPDKVVEILGSGRFILGDSFENTSKMDATITASSFGIKHSAHCVRTSNGMVSVKFEEHHYTFQISNPLTGQANQSKALDDIMSPMTGRIIDISVSKGDNVVKGQAVAVVEAMKMEHRLVAPRDGKIDKVNCVVGDAVDDGKVLISLIQAEAEHA